MKEACSRKEAAQLSNLLVLIFSPDLLKDADLIAERPPPEATKRNKEGGGFACGKPSALKRILMMRLFILIVAGGAGLFGCAALPPPAETSAAEKTAARQTKKETTKESGLKKSERLAKLSSKSAARKALDFSPAPQAAEATETDAPPPAPSSRADSVTARLLDLSRQAESAEGGASRKERKQALKKGRALIKRLSGAELHELLKSRKDIGLFRGEAAFQAGKRMRKNRRFKEARAYFKRARAQLPPGAARSQAEIYLKTSRLPVNPHLTGVILPLSGRRAVIGEKVLKGIRLGLGLQEDSPWRIAVMDSGSLPDRARQAARKLLFEYKAIGIIGGLSGKTASVIAETAEANNAPAVLLSQKQSLTKNRLFIFQSALSGKALMQHLASGLVDDFKIKTAAMLVPEDNYGKSYARLFEEAFQGAGGEIVRKAVYSPGETDFKNPVKKSVKLFDLKDRQEEYEKLKAEFLEKNPHISERRVKLTPERLLKPETDFQALFIPDSLKVVQRIVPYLKYFDIKDIHLAGTNLWKRSGESRAAQALDRDKRRAASGSGKTAAANAQSTGAGFRADSNKEEGFPLVFAAAAEPSQKRRSLFHLKFQKAFQSKPGFFETQGYNTALALRAAFEKRPKDRFQLQKALESIESFEGALSPLQIKKDHTFAGPLELYTATANGK